MERFKSLAHVVCAARGLAVDGDEIVPIGPERLDPAFETPSEQRRVDAIDQSLKPPHAWDAELELREPSQKIEVLLALVLEVVARGDGGASRKQEDLSKAIPHPLRLPVRIDLREMLEEGSHARGISSPSIASIVVHPRKSRLARQDEILHFGG